MLLRKQGNEAYAFRDFHKAVALYTEALASERDPAALSNRSACFIQLKDWTRAQKDARDALALDPSTPLRIKLFYRLAVSTAELGQDPTPYIKQGLLLDPASSELRALDAITFVPVQTADTLPHRYSVKPAPAGPVPESAPRPAQNPASECPPPPAQKYSTFQPPILPLTYQGVTNACRENSPDAYDWWYSIDPEQLVQAHKRVSIEPCTLEYLRKMVASRGGEQGQRLLEASKRCNGYTMADMMLF